MIDSAVASSSRIFSVPMALRLAELVEHESPSHDKHALDALGAVLAGWLGKLGASVEIIANSQGGNHVLARFAGKSELRPALVLGHFDTVWPLGTLDAAAVPVDDNGRAFGPGVFDMKASLLIFLEVMEHFQKHELMPPRPICVS